MIARSSAKSTKAIRMPTRHAARRPALVVDGIANDRAGHAMPAAAAAAKLGPEIVMTSMPSLRSSVLV